MTLEELKNKKILILGLGREGRSALNYLSKHLPGRKFAIADEKEIKELPEVSIEKTFFGEGYLEHLSEYEVVIKSPGITPYLPEIEKAKKDGVNFTQSTAIFFDEFKGQIIGVTGTKGKSTTSSLIYQMLKTAGIKSELIGNIGNPPLSYLDVVDSETTVVFELSSYQLEDLEKSPQTAVFTNFYPEHLNYHKSLDEYLEAKFHITKFQTQEDYFVYNSDFPELKNMAQHTKAVKIPFSKDSYVEEFESSLLGDFNKLNIIAATIVGQILLISDEAISQALKEFKPLEHRLEFVTEKSGIKFYNDSLATIPQATTEAIKALGEDVETLIAGGFDRGVDYAPLGEAIVHSNIKNLILFPTTGEKIWEEVKRIQNSEFRIQRFDVNSMKEAVKLAFEHTSKGRICLLSPASTSFNMFKDYAQRGNQFKEEVKNF